MRLCPVKENEFEPPFRSPRACRLIRPPGFRLALITAPGAGSLEILGRDKTRLNE